MVNATANHVPQNFQASKNRREPGVCFAPPPLRVCHRDRTRFAIVAAVERRGHSSLNLVLNSWCGPNLPATPVDGMPRTPNERLNLLRFDGKNREQFTVLYWPFQIPQLEKCM